MGRNLEHGGRNSHRGAELGTRRTEPPSWGGTWSSADGTPIMEGNLELGGRNPHRGAEHGSRNPRRGAEHGTRRTEPPSWGRTWNSADGTPVVGRNFGPGRWNSQCGAELGTWRMEPPMRGGTWNMADGTLISVFAVAKTSKTMLNNSGESGQPCLVPDITGNGFSFSPLRTMLAVCLSCMAFIMLR